LSLLEFATIQYKRRGNAVADDGQLSRIAKIPKREFMRRGINQHTLEKICRQEPVRAIKLAECLKVLEEYEASKCHREVNEFYKKQLIAPWAQSLVPETCRCTAMFASLVKDSVRRAKADFPLVPLCPVKSMAPVLAIADMVARAIDMTAL
jgi:hypothetical protein